MQSEAITYEQLHKKKGQRTTAIVHIILLILALLPFIKIDNTKNIDTQYAVQIAFNEPIVFKESKSSNSNKAKSEEGAKRPDVPKERPTEKPVQKVETQQPKEVVKVTPPTPTPLPEVKTPETTPTPTEPVVTEILTEEAEVVAVEEEIEVEIPEPEVYEAPAPVDIPTAEPEVSSAPSLPSLEDVLKEIEEDISILTDGLPSDNEETTEAEEGGGLASDSEDDADSGTGTGEEGLGKGDGDEGEDNDDGIGTGGSGEGEYDDSGDGVFGRKVIHRDYSMIETATGKSGIIVFTVCINREGTVSWSEINEFESTIKDREIRKAALRSLNKYRYEPDPSAPREQCGKHKINVDNFNGLVPNN